MLEKSVLPLLGVAGQISRRFICRRRHRSSSGRVQMLAFRDLIDEKDIAHRAVCLWGQEMRITEHFVFQGASRRSLNCGVPFRASGYGWVLAGSGGFWAGSGGFWVGSGA